MLRILGLGLLCLLASACTSSQEGDVKCTDGVCEPKAVYVNGSISMVLVTPETVYAADARTCSVYAGQKPLVEAARVVSRKACGVSSLARTDWGVYWSTSPFPTEADKTPKGTFAWMPDGQTEATVVDEALDRPGGIAAIGDTVFVAVGDGIRMLPRGATTLERAVDAIEPHALRAFQGALYWHDGLGAIYTWRSGDPKATKVVATGFAASLQSSPFHEERFLVDESGLYWLGGDLFGIGDLFHAPLAGGKPEKLLEKASVVRALTSDDEAIYWAEADQGLLTQKTTIHRLTKSDDAAKQRHTVVGELAADVGALQSTPEGLYLTASRVFEIEKDKPLGMKAFAGPLMILPREVLQQL